MLFLTEHNAWMNWDGIGMNFDKLGWIWDLFFDTVLSVWHLRWWFFVKLIKTCAEAVACNDVVLLVLRQRRWDSSSFMHINSRCSSPVPLPCPYYYPCLSIILYCDVMLFYPIFGFLLLPVMLDFNAIFGSVNFWISVAACDARLQCWAMPLPMMRLIGYDAYDVILHSLASFYNSVSAQFDGRRLSPTTVCSVWVLSVLLL